MFSSMFTGSSTPEVAPGDYYDYDFIHETNDSEFLSEFPYPNEISPEMKVKYEMSNIQMLSVLHLHLK